jgi:hypothetical protein
MSPKGLSKDRSVFRIYSLPCIQVAVSEWIALLTGQLTIDLWIVVSCLACSVFTEW